MEASHCLTICGISKQLSCAKLKSLLGAVHLEENLWHLRIIPLEDSNMAQVFCATSEVRKRFLNANLAPPLLNYKLKMYAVNDFYNSPQPLVNNLPTILSLPEDCQRLIFEKCALKEQIALAKVCGQFQVVISDIWRCTHKTLTYNLYDFEFKFNLSANELLDFCALAGRFVVKLVFNSVFFFPLIQRHLMSSGGSVGNLMENAKRLMNMNLCRHLIYFENLEIFEVQGKFLADFAVDELGRYCKQLRVFRLLDADTRWLYGKDFHMLKNLQELYVKDCEKFQRKNFSRICRELKLKCLNIVECKCLQNARFMEKLCKSLDSLEEFQLTALADAPMLAAILKLNHLKILQFYWLNDFEAFEELLFEQLGRYKGESLISLKFSQDRLFIDNESLECLSAFKYAVMREHVTINGKAWQWHEGYENQCRRFGNFRNLQSITCEYCRLFSSEDLLDLPKICENLKSLELIGCRTVAEDANLLRDWREIHSTEDDSLKCHLAIEGLIPGTVVQSLRQHVRQLPYRTEHNKQPVLRSIECRFQ